MTMAKDESEYDKSKAAMINSGLGVFTEEAYPRSDGLCPFSRAEIAFTAKDDNGLIEAAAALTELALSINAQLILHAGLRIRRFELSKNLYLTDGEYAALSEDE